MSSYSNFGMFSLTEQKNPAASGFRVVLLRTSVSQCWNFTLSVLLLALIHGSVITDASLKLGAPFPTCDPRIVNWAGGRGAADSGRRSSIRWHLRLWHFHTGQLSIAYPILQMLVIRKTQLPGNPLIFEIMNLSQSSKPEFDFQHDGTRSYNTSSKQFINIWNVFIKPES